MLDKSQDESLTNQMLKSNYIMLDAIGINSHHDAVSGTSKQAVVNDYIQKLYEAMTQNNEVYNRAISNTLFKNTGLISNEDWQ